MEVETSGEGKDEEIISLQNGEVCPSNHTSWTKNQTHCLLKLIKEYEYVSQLHANKKQVYVKLSKLMTISGYKKSCEEIETYLAKLENDWKNFSDAKISNFPYYDELNALYSPESQSEPEIIIIKDDESDTCESSAEKKNKGRNWNYKETECLIEILEKYGLPSHSQVRKVTLVAVDYLGQHGFIRTEEQMHVKIKHLRGFYHHLIRRNTENPDLEFPFFNRLHALMMQEIKEEDVHEETQNYIAFDILNPKSADESEYIDVHNSSQKRRQSWTEGEVCLLLKFIEENGVTTGQQLRKVCSKVVDFLAEQGSFRTPAQILVRWKNMKALYWAVYRKKLKYPDKEYPFFARIHAILNPRDDVYVVNSIDEQDDDNNNSFCDETQLQNAVSSSNEEPVVKRARSDSGDGKSIGVCTFCSSWDSVDHYCISLSSSIKKLDARKQAKLKIEIQQLLFKAEFDSSF